MVNIRQSMTQSVPPEQPVRKLALASTKTESDIEMPSATKKGRTMKVLGFIGSLVILLIAMGIGKSVGLLTYEGLFKSSSTVDVNQVLVQTANTMNRQLPMMLDSQTRWDTTIPGPGKRITYVYTSVDYRASEIDRNEAFSYLASKLRQFARGSKKMELFFRNGITVVYYYRGNDGALVMEIPIKPGDCGYSP